MSADPSHFNGESGGNQFFKVTNLAGQGSENEDHRRIRQPTSKVETTVKKKLFVCIDRMAPPLGQGRKTEWETWQGGVRLVHLLLKGSVDGKKTAKS